MPLFSFFGTAYTFSPLQNTSVKRSPSSSFSPCSTDCGRLHFVKTNSSWINRTSSIRPASCSRYRAARPNSSRLSSTICRDLRYHSLSCLPSASSTPPLQARAYRISPMPRCMRPYCSADLVVTGTKSIRSDSPDSSS